MLDWYKRLIPLFLFLIVLLPVSLAVAPITDISFEFNTGLIIQTPLFDYHKQNTNMSLRFHVYNLSNGINLDNKTINCDFYLYSGAYEVTGKKVIDIIDMPVGTNRRCFKAEMSQNNFTNIGLYYYYIHCNNSDVGGFSFDSFVVTETGEEEIAIVQNTEDELLLYFVFALSIILLIVAFYKDDHNLAAISGMLQMILGGYLLVAGFSDFTNALSNAIGMIFIAVGFYILLRSSIENF